MVRSHFGPSHVAQTFVARVWRLLFAVLVLVLTYVRLFS